MWLLEKRRGKEEKLGPLLDCEWGRGGGEKRLKKYNSGTREKVERGGGRSMGKGLYVLLLFFLSFLL